MKNVNKTIEIQKWCKTHNVPIDLYEHLTALDRETLEHLYKHKDYVWKVNEVGRSVQEKRENLHERKRILSQALERLHYKC